MFKVVRICISMHDSCIRFQQDISAPPLSFAVWCPVTMPSSRTEKNGCEPLEAAQVGAKVIGNMGAVATGMDPFGDPGNNFRF
jgi:hypothetical protein